MLNLLCSLLVCQGLTNGENYELSEKILNSITPLRQQQNHYYYLRIVNNYFLNEDKKLSEFLPNYEGFSEDTAERRKNIVGMIRNEVNNWKEAKTSEDKHHVKLLDISRDMRFVHNRLNNTNMSKNTLERQDIIIKKLDEMIEQKINDMMPKKGDGKSENAGKLKGETQPLQDSLPVEGNNGLGKLDDKVLKNLQQSWGSLPPKERARAIQGLLKDYPAKYKLIIEEYEKALNRTSPP